MLKVKQAPSCSKLIIHSTDDVNVISTFRERRTKGKCVSIDHETPFYRSTFLFSLTIVNSATKLNKTGKEVSRVRAGKSVVKLFSLGGQFNECKSDALASDKVDSLSTYLLK